MNITGNKNYSKATVGLRQPSRHLMDQNLKMVFVYPMLFADKLGKHKEFLRQFLTITFLKEIFISNSLNLISMASQVRPIVDEHGQEVDVASVIGNTILTNSAANNSVQANRIPMPSYTQDYGAKSELQHRIRERTAIIQKLINIDPRTSSLLPYVEMITMDNLIDVPVIVGTKTFDISTLTLTYILIAAIGMKKKLDTYENVEEIIDKLKKMKQSEWYSLIKKDVKPSQVKSLADKVGKVPLIGQHAKNAINNVSSTIAPYITSPRPKFAEPSEEVKMREFQTDETFHILKLVKNDLDQAKLFFKFMLHPELIKSQMGLDRNAGQVSTAVTKISPQMKQIFGAMHSNFMKYLAMPGTLLLRSVSNVMYPIGSGIEFVVVKEETIDSGLNRSIQKNIEDNLLERLKSSIGGAGSEVSSNQMKMIKHLCENLGTEVSGVFTDVIDAFKTHSIDSITYNGQQFQNFAKTLEQKAGECGSHNKRFEQTFSHLVSNGDAVLKLIRQDIYAGLQNFMQEYAQAMDDPNVEIAAGRTLGMSKDNAKHKFIPSVTDNLFQIFYFFFLYSLQIAICNYVKILDVEIESAKNDVLDLPNYTLVLPLPIITALYSAMLAKNWQEIVSGSSGVTSLTENYVKGVVKFISMKLGVPNIIVVDDIKNKIYYKFQYMSGINATSIQTLETFIKAHINKELSA